MHIECEGYSAYRACVYVYIVYSAYTEYTECTPYRVSSVCKIQIISRFKVHTVYISYRVCIEYTAYII